MPDLEKLRAIVPEGEPEWRYDTWGTGPGTGMGMIRSEGALICVQIEEAAALQILAMRAAWPLVMAVVEAAEQFRVQIPTLASNMNAAPLCAALDALKEKA